MKKDVTSIKQNGLKICCKKQSDIPFKDPTRNQKRSIALGSGVFCVVHGGEDKRSLGGGFCCGEDRKSSTKAFNMVGYCLAKQLPPISRADQTSRKVNIPTFFLQKNCCVLNFWQWVYDLAIVIDLPSSMFRDLFFHLSVSVAEIAIGVQFHYRYGSFTLGRNGF